MKATPVKIILGIAAAVIVAFGFINFFVSINTPTRIPILISHPLAMLAMAYLLFQFIFPRMLYPSSPHNTSEGIDKVHLSGTELATGLCGGSIGMLHFRGPLIRVRVFPGGLLIKPLLMPAAPILREEITVIQEKQQLLTSMIELIHTSKSIHSPLRLGFSKNSSVDAALLLLQDPILHDH